MIVWISWRHLIKGWIKACLGTSGESYREKGIGIYCFPFNPMAMSLSTENYTCDQWLRNHLRCDKVFFLSWCLPGERKCRRLSEAGLLENLGEDPMYKYDCAPFENMAATGRLDKIKNIQNRKDESSSFLSPPCCITVCVCQRLNALICKVWWFIVIFYAGPCARRRHQKSRLGLWPQDSRTNKQFVIRTPICAAKG